MVITHPHLMFNTEVEAMDKRGKVTSYEMQRSEDEQEEKQANTG